MKKHCITNNVKNISMPLIGCGLDRLDWNKVKILLYKIFNNTSIQITVYKLKLT